MCTITFLPRQSGYVLAMNRDEKLTRTTALPPVRCKVQGQEVLYPSEPTGGTWISLNHSGVCLALVNWYLMPDRVEDGISRGEIVKSSMHVETVLELGEALRQLPLKNINPFRLVSVFAQSREVAEWEWNLRELRVLSHAWEANTWSSSGYDEIGAQEVRRKIFKQSLQQGTADSLRWVRELHCSHLPERGPYSICMHRSDAMTVSYTEAVVGSHSASMRYQPGAPCGGLPATLCRFKRRR